MSITTIERVIPAVQQYPWGKKGKESAVARLLPEFSPENPYAELWIGSHPSAPSRIENSAGQSLREFIAIDPRACLGDTVLAQFGDLPFLLKILSVGAPLSIQAHPDRVRAHRLHQTSPQHYPDKNHKPEMGVALTPVHLLFGLKERSHLIDTFARYPALLTLVPQELVTELRGASSSLSEAELRRETYRSILTAPVGERVGVVYEICEGLSTHSPTTLFERLIPQLVETYGAEDIGILSGLLLNEIILSPGQAIFIAPNTPHAYLSGDLIECMAASDNVVRAGLTQKYQDIETLLEMLDYEASPERIIEPRSLPGAENIRQYETPTAEFLLSISDHAEKLLSFRTEEKPEILLILEGTADVIVSDGTSVALRAGEGVFVPAAVHHYEINCLPCSFVRVTIPNS